MKWECDKKLGNSKTMGYISLMISHGMTLISNCESKVMQVEEKLVWLVFFAPASTENPEGS